MARALDQARSRAENRVELFLDAARELMSTNSGEFTVQEVVERSGQSLRTFYQYFAGKHELLLALFEESIRAAAAHLEEVVAESDDAARPAPPLRRRVLPDVPAHAEGRTAPSAPRPTIVEFAQQLLDVAPEGSRAGVRAARRRSSRSLLDRCGGGRRRPRRPRPPPDRRGRAAGDDVQHLRCRDQRITVRASTATPNPASCGTCCCAASASSTPITHPGSAHPPGRGWCRASP